MEIIGIVAEYNPFHNGHLYHINKIKEKYPDSLIVCILNGYFTQRGTPSIITKEEKTKICLENNIDIVIEHPFFFSSQSADFFADSALFLLNELKVNRIIFGSESNNIEELKKIAVFQIKNDLQDKIKKEIKKGNNYPTALSGLVKSNIDLNNPNDILGIAYIKSILKNNYNISYESIQRTNNYHDIESNDFIISASNIRNKIKQKENITKFIPKDYEKYINTIDEKIFFTILKYSINMNSKLENILTVDEGIENLLTKKINDAKNLEDYINLIKTKRYTYNKIRRMFIHIISLFTKDDRNKIINPTYIKILGFNKKGRLYLRTLKNNKECLLNKKIDNDDIVLNYERRSAFLYNLITKQNVLEFERKNKPIKKD